jgi:hypothetical protein
MRAVIDEGAHAGSRLSIHRPCAPANKPGIRGQARRLWGVARSILRMPTLKEMKKSFAFGEAVGLTPFAPFGDAP